MVCTLDRSCSSNTRFLRHMALGGAHNPQHWKRNAEAGRHTEVYCAIVNILRNTNFSFEFCLLKNFATAPKIGKNFIIFAISFLRNSVLRSCFGGMSQNFFHFCTFFAFGILLGVGRGGGGFIHFGATSLGWKQTLLPLAIFCGFHFCEGHTAEN